MKPTRVVLTLSDTGQGPPLDVRLARLLKVCLRIFSLRCVDVRVSGDNATINANVADATERGTGRPGGIT